MDIRSKLLFSRYQTYTVIPVVPCPHLKAPWAAVWAFRDHCYEALALSLTYSWKSASVDGTSNCTLHLPAVSMLEYTDFVGNISATVSTCTSSPSRMKVIWDQSADPVRRYHDIVPRQVVTCTCYTGSMTPSRRPRLSHCWGRERLPF